MAEYRAITVEKGSGGFGGPLTIQGTEKKNKVMYITGGGVAPETAASIPRSASPPSTSTPSARQAPWPSSSRKTSTYPA